MTKEAYSGKHTEGNVKEAGHNEQFSANNAEFQRARSLLDKASKESAQADAYTKQAYEKWVALLSQSACLVGVLYC